MTGAVQTTATIHRAVYGTDILITAGVSGQVAFFNEHFEIALNIVHCPPLINQSINTSNCCNFFPT